MTQEPGSDGSWLDWRRGDQSPGDPPQSPGQTGDGETYSLPGYPQAPAQSVTGTQYGYPQTAHQYPGHQPGHAPGAAYYQQTAAWHQHTATVSQGQSHATTALICGILGFFVVGFVLGPVAIVQAKKAQRLGADATPGLILGWIVTVLYAIGILLVGLLIVLGIIGAVTGG